MKYDFDREIDRLGTGSVKWEFFWEGEDSPLVDMSDPDSDGKRLLPLWVADMDFSSPQPVIDALVERARHGIFGYTARTQEYEQAVVGWMQKRYDWQIQPEWILTTHGVVSSFNMLVQTFVRPGQKVIVQPPVYHPFFYAIENNGAVQVNNPLRLQEDKYHLDFEGLAGLVQDPDAKLLMLCSPHNPVGRVWRPEELTRLAQICTDAGVLVVSDEVHADLIYRGVRFTAYGTLGEAYAENLVVCTAPSKTFNLPGLKTSNVIIQNQDLRQAYQQTLTNAGIYNLNIFGATALVAAYSQGEEWLDQMMHYVEDNFRYLDQYLASQVPELKVIKPEGTYLVWVDCRGLGIEHSELNRILLQEARVYLDDGAVFGEQGIGFLRINIACPRSILAEALIRMVGALAQSRGG